MPNKGMEVDFEKLALFKTTHAGRCVSIIITALIKEIGTKNDL